MTDPLLAAVIACAGGYTFGCIITYLLYRPKIKLGEAVLEAKDVGELKDLKEWADG